MVKIIESVRDGLQGLNTRIPTSKKIDYINALLKVGFDAIDIGSLVSPKAIPQMADTLEVISKLDLSGTTTKRMVLVANKKGAEQAAGIDKIDQLIYPFSISSTFLQKNINADFVKAEKNMDDIIEICHSNHKEPIIYLAMAFGNPYGNLWNLELIHEWVEKIIRKGVKTIPLSDITGESNPQKIKEVYSSLIVEFPKVEFGFHLHAKPDDWYEKLDAAYQAGCRRFDSVLGGLGGCPMTGYELLSNLDTMNLIDYLDEQTNSKQINTTTLQNASKIVQGF